MSADKKQYNMVDWCIDHILSSKIWVLKHCVLGSPRVAKAHQLGYFSATAVARLFQQLIR